MLAFFLDSLAFNPVFDRWAIYLAFALVGLGTWLLQEAEGANQNDVDTQDKKQFGWGFILIGVSLFFLGLKLTGGLLVLYTLGWIIAESAKTRFRKTVR